MKTEIKLDPNIPNRIVRVDYPELVEQIKANKLPYDFDELLKMHYLIVVDGFLTPEELKVFHECQVIPRIERGAQGYGGGGWKKLPLNQRRSLANRISPNPKAFLAQLKIALHRASKVLRKLHPNTKFVKKPTAGTVRFSETAGEELHFDVYDKRLLRLAANLDDQPRHWRTSYHIDEVRDKAGLSAGARISQLNHFMHPMRSGPDPLVPAHDLFFAPGTAWIADTRNVSHQIVYGRKSMFLGLSYKPQK